VCCLITMPHLRHYHIPSAKAKAEPKNNEGSNLV
jgi:hypothetical protein